MILLDSLVALAILASAVVSLLGLLVAGAEAVRRASEAERNVAAADRLLAGLSLLTDQEYAARLGRTRLGAYLVDISRPAPRLYRVGVRSVAHPESELLMTLVTPAGTAP